MDYELNLGFPFFPNFQFLGRLNEKFSEIFPGIFGKPKILGIPEVREIDYYLIISLIIWPQEEWQIRFF